MAQKALLRRISFYADLDEADQQVIMDIEGREQTFDKIAKSLMPARKWIAC
ncbi:hypothetical protein [Sphingopyxis sp. BSNA05]|uniref:hypothetical protein n=1 Tax=Sphingopyxis sp. BSNA05 TaxID=1236614 RepID=UPI0015634E1D|nr:hypothetical protein [Sphingopyxis sp. BSNA05]